MAELADQ